jgi:hypothetical protein
VLFCVSVVTETPGDPKIPCIHRNLCWIFVDMIVCFKEPMPSKWCQSLGNVLIYASVFSAAETCANKPLPSNGLLSDSTIPAFRHHVILCCYPQYGIALCSREEYWRLQWNWVLKCIMFWDMTPNSLTEVYLHFGGTCRLHLQGWMVSHTACYSFDLLFYSKAEGSLLLWKFCQLLPDSMESHCRRQSLLWELQR